MTTEVILSPHYQKPIPETLAVTRTHDFATPIAQQRSSSMQSAYGDLPWIFDDKTIATYLDMSARLNILHGFPIEPRAKRIANSIANDFRRMGHETIADGFRALYVRDQALIVSAIYDSAAILKHQHTPLGGLTGLECDNDGVVHLRWDNDAESLTIMVACLARHRVRYFVREQGELRCDAACHSDDTVGVLHTFFDRL